MGRAGAELDQQRPVLNRGIALVPGKAVFGMTAVQLDHQPVAVLLGQDRGGADAGFGEIALDDGIAGDAVQRRRVIAVGQHPDRSRIQGQYCAAHGQQAGLENVQAVDLFHRGLGHGMAQGLLADEDFQLLAALGGEFLGVGQAVDGPRRIEDHRGRHHRAGQRSAAGLVDAGDQRARGREISGIHTGFCGFIGYNRWFFSERETMSNPLKVAVVGAGHLGKWHADKYAAHPHCELVAVVDSNPETAAAIAARHGARAVTDYKEILDAVDAVSLVVPTSLHFPIARDLLEAGIHCLIEKPITETVEEAQQLIDLARARGLVLQVGHIERFNAVMMDIDDILDRPRFIESSRLAPFTPRATDVSVILDLMIHDIDIILDLIDSPIRDLRASGISVLSDQIDIANARIEFADGCVANVTASRISRKRERRLRIFQKDAYISADFQDRILAINRKDGKTGEHGYPGISHEQREYDNTDALNLEVLDFIRAIHTGEPPRVTGEDGKRALETATRITQLIQG